MATEQALWLLTSEGQQLLALDASTGRTLGSVDTPPDVAEFRPDAAALDGVLWAVADGTDKSSRLVGVDLDTREVVAVEPVEDLEFGIAAGFGSVWVPKVRTAVLQRFTPGD